jgi:hypothetical protein
VTARMLALLMVGLALLAHPARAEKRITIEKATVPWSELERLLSREGQNVERPDPSAPRRYAISTAEVEGTIEGGRAELELQLEIDVLAPSWTVVPLLPAGLSVAHAELSGPRKHLLARDGAGVALVVQGAGHYRVALRCEGKLGTRGGQTQLHLPLPGLTGGTAHLTLSEPAEVAGATPWRRELLPDGTQALSATLGEGGLELLLAGDDTTANQASGALEELSARTVLALGGSGVTRLSVLATPGGVGALDLELPAGARVWKIFVGGVPVEPTGLVRGNHLRVPLRRPSRVELAYTFAAPPLGIRGRYHLDLPRFSVPVRGASWQLFLPQGLTYSETQAALGVEGSCSESASRIPLPGQGVCVAMRRPVLEGPAYAEGSYEQAL